MAETLLLEFNPGIDEFNNCKNSLEAFSAFLSGIPEDIVKAYKKTQSAIQNHPIKIPALFASLTPKDKQELIILLNNWKPRQDSSHTAGNV